MSLVFAKGGSFHEKCNHFSNLTNFSKNVDSGAEPEITPERKN